MKEMLGIIFEVDAKMQEAQAAQQMAEIRNEAKRHAERMAAITEWSKPEAVKDRLEQHAREAVAALERAKAMSAALGEQEDIPLPDPLPKHMVGQSLSTIKAMLRHERVWKKPDEGFWNPQPSLEKRETTFRVLDLKGNKVD